MAAAPKLVDDRRREPGLQSQRPRRDAARVEGRDQVIGVELGRVDRLLQVQPAIDMAQEDVKAPLLLLVATGGAPGEPGLPLAKREAGRQRRTRTRARTERRRQTFLEPEHLGPRSERPAEVRDHRRAIEPATARGGGDHVPPPVDDVDVDGVASRRLPRSCHLPGLHESRETAHAGLVRG